MKKLALAVAMCAQVAAAVAGGNAAVVCGDGSPLTPWSTNTYPNIRISYSTGSDAGRPGLFWFGVLTPDQQRGAVMTPSGWQNYEGGLYPFHSRHDAGLRSTISLVVPLPGNALTTAEFVGHSIYLGHGVYTPDAQQKVASRRATLNRIKADMQAKGRWRAEFDTDEYFIWTLVQKDMTDNGKYGQVFTIPFVDCTPPQQGGGGS